MGLFDGCLLASDIDDTLLYSGYINPINIEKINYFIKEGGVFSLASGRSAKALYPIVKEIGGISVCVTANGSMIYDFSTSKVLYEEHIPKTDYHIAADIMKSSPAVGVEVHTGMDILVINRTSECDDHAEYEDLEPRYVSFEEAEGYGWNKVLYLCNSEKERKSLREEASKNSSASFFLETTAVINGKVRYYFEQVPKNISKNSALERLCKMRGIKAGGYFSIGDYYNDVEMLKGADISAVPCAAPEDVKIYADYITVSCKDGAVADFIDYLTGVMSGRNKTRTLK